jgi:hypothetical protein
MTDSIRCKGDIEMTIEWDDGRTEVTRFPNTVLRNGRKALAASLANQYGDNYDYFISRMAFGNGGTSGSTPKFISEDRNGFFGSTILRKPVITTLDPNDLTQVIFTAVIARDEVNGQTINEMGLEMNTDPRQMYSMTTWAGFTKSSQMQITWTWRLSFL